LGLFLLGRQLAVGVRKAKVYNFDVFLAVEQHVLRLEVAMHDPQSVQVIYSVDDLMEKSTGLSLAEPKSALSYFFCSAM
jgi:hypothetical protein